MVLEKPKEKTISKLENLKVESNHLLYPLKEVGAAHVTRFCVCKPMGSPLKFCRDCNSIELMNISFPV